MCNLNIVPNKTGSVLGMLSKFFNTTACISSCMCAPVCVKGSISPSRSLHVAPLLSGCQPMVSSLPSIARRVTPLPVVTSTSDPLLPDYAQFSPSALPFSLSGSIPRLMQGNMLQADRQGRGWHTRAHTHTHTNDTFSQHGSDTELDPRPTGHPGSAGCGSGGAGV